jgi:DNA-3-methyladenine glycosylase II
MQMQQKPTEVRAAEALAGADPVMSSLVEECGPLALKPTDDYFFTLVDSIASQQLSSKVAATIVRRIKALVPGKETLNAEDIDALPDEALRGVGLSWSKVRYIKDLAAHVLSGELDLAHISQLEDEEIIKELVMVKGIGRWTAEMFLIFSLARPDVLAVDDFGLRAGMQRLYGLPDLPKPAQMREIAEPWKPYRSYASLYLWHGHETSPKVAAMQQP